MTLKGGDKMDNKEYINFLEERSEKLRKLESMIIDLQMNANDRPEEVRLSHDDLKMEVFRLWYFITYGKEYDL